MFWSLHKFGAVLFTEKHPLVLSHDVCRQILVLGHEVVDAMSHCDVVGLQVYVLQASAGQEFLGAE